MKSGAQTVPYNVLRFEVLLYASLLLDALSFPFRDGFTDLAPRVEMMMNLIGAGLIVLFCYLVWVAARKRSNWARWVLVLSLLLSIISLADVLSDQGWTLASVIDVCSSALTAWGLYMSFTGDARGWFTA
jgi:hypothetical protein